MPFLLLLSGGRDERPRRGALDNLVAGRLLQPRGEGYRGLFLRAVLPAGALVGSNFYLFTPKLTTWELLMHCGSGYCF